MPPDYSAFTGTGEGFRSHDALLGNCAIVGNSCAAAVAAINGADYAILAPRLGA